MTVDDKQKMIDALQPAITEGGKFGRAMFDSLVNDWGADKFQIDQDRLIEMGTGHFIDCIQKGVDLSSPAKYIADSLASRSDYGLSKMGLTRKQYMAAKAL